jgi:hypothetical protein
MHHCLLLGMAVPQWVRHLMGTQSHAYIHQIKKTLLHVPTTYHGYKSNPYTP